VTRSERVLRCLPVHECSATLRVSEFLARGLFEMLGKSDAARRDLGARARARVSANYAFPCVVEVYRALYNGLGGGRTLNE
jgi:hypothetical protein